MAVATYVIQQSHGKMSELYQYLCMVAPFGTLLNNSVTNAKFLMTNGYPSGPMPRQKVTILYFLCTLSGTILCAICMLQVPAWRPGVYKGTSRLFLSIKEEINTMQYDNSTIPDVGEVFGSIICKVVQLSTVPMHICIVGRN